MIDVFKEAKSASYDLRKASSSKRSNAIFLIAQSLRDNVDKILEANQIDVDNATNLALTKAMIERLKLDRDSVYKIAENIESISRQNDVIGEVVSGRTLKNNLKFLKVRVPIGVVAIIFESRPNVTVDCAALCLRSGNVAILRGGKEAINSNRALINIVNSSLKEAGLPENSVILIEDPDRDKILPIVQAKGFIDLVIPRGGAGLINYVTENALVPVIKHDKGVCSIYVDEYANIEMALNIIYNAKVSRPSACNAVETVLINEKIANNFIPKLFDKLKDTVLMKGCEKTLKIVDIDSAEDDWGAEFLDYILNIRVIDDIDDAIKHISTFGSSHSDSIITDSYKNAEYFLDTVDSACVYVNSSTRFTDGAEFGLGAEIGISTSKIHSRGPMGADDLTTTKYKVYGTGQIRI